MINNLRREHFTFGQHGPTLNSSSKAIGTSSANASPAKPGSWSTRHSNCNLGSDALMKQSDYQNRFADVHLSGPPPAAQAHTENLKNKAKITSTSVRIAQSSFFDQSTTNKTFYNDVSNSSRQQNTGLDPLTASYI